MKIYVVIEFLTTPPGTNLQKQAVIACLRDRLAPTFDPWPEDHYGTTFEVVDVQEQTIPYKQGVFAYECA